MMRRSLTLLAAILPLPLVAQERPMTGAEFEAFVQGRTMDTYGEDGWVGVETFLPGRRSLWRDDKRCMKGSWTETDGIICYTYDDDPGVFCSSFYNRGDWLLGFEDGVWGQDPILLYPSDEVVSCDDPLSS